MIYYTSNNAEFLHKTLFCLSQGYELMSKIMTVKDLHHAQRLLEKWDERYELLLTPQQQHRKFLNGSSTFCCIVRNYVEKNEEFVPSESAWADFEFAPNHSEFQMHTQGFHIFLFCRVNPMLLVQNGEKIEPTDRQKISYINEQLRKEIKSCEEFSICSLQSGGYRVIRKTKRAKSLKELQDLSLSENSKHATDWTWELTKEKYAQLREVGINLVQQYHDFCSKQVRSSKEKALYWEKHFKSLEGLVGFRGVRSQVGKIWNEEATLFHKKYNQQFVGDYSHARKLKLSYIKASKMKIENNSLIEDALKQYQDVHIQYLKILHDDWKKKNLKD